ncbi:MAG TPA: hypothetical protein VJL29_00090 [Thermoguttaceae bacterium]|nr:hypothetical protein [Thermoguttaceae bacterium]
MARTTRIFLSIVVVMTLAPVATAATRYLQVADGSWGTAANWGGNKPGTNDYAVVGATSGGVTTGLARVTTSSGNSCKALELGYQASTSGTLVLSGSGKLTSSWEYIGDSGTGLFQQTGGTHILTNSDGMWLGYNVGAVGTYELSDGAIQNGGSSNNNYVKKYIGYYGTGIFTQTGGTHTLTDQMTLGVASGSSGTYTLTGGSLNTQKNLTGGVFVGGGGNGTFYLGNATSTGTMGQSGSGSNGGALSVRDGYFSTGSGKFIGWGDVGYTGWFQNSGQVIADGYGQDRDLNMSSFTSLTQDLNNTTTNGWFATNHGRLILPQVSISARSTPKSYNWGEAVYGTSYGQDTTLDMVNSVQMEFASVTAAGRVDIALLASEREDVAAGLVNPVGIWDFSISSGLAFSNADLTFRYDDASAAALGVSEADLKLFHFDQGQWQEVTSVVLDENTNTLQASGLTSFSTYAVATAVIPEPGMLSLLGIGFLSLLVGTSRQHGR